MEQPIQESATSTLRLVLDAFNPPLIASGAAVLVVAGMLAYVTRAGKRGRGLPEQAEEGGKAFSKAAAALAILYFLVYSYLSVHRYHKLLTWSWDLGIFESLLANALKGRFFVDYRGPFDHLSPALVFYLPFYALWRDPRILLVVQAAVFALGAWPLYLLIRERTGSRNTVAAVVIAYLLYPMLSAGNLHDFHAVSMTPVFFFAALYFMERRWWKWYWVFVCLVLSVRETEAILVFCIGIYLLSRKDYLRGGLTAGLAVVWVAAALFVVMPAITGEGYRHFAYFGGLSETASWAAQAQPERAVLARRIATSAAVMFFALLPVGFLPAKRLRPFLFLFLPIVGAYLLSNNWNVRTISGHYGLPVTAATFGAAALALSSAGGEQDSRRPARAAFLLTCALCCNILFSYPGNQRWEYTSAIFRLRNSFNILSLPLPFTAERRRFYTTSDHEEFFHAARACVPRGSSVTAGRNLAVFFATGYDLEDLTGNVESDYYLLDMSEGYGTKTDVYRGLAAALLSREGIVRFLDTSAPGKPGFVFFASESKWLDFYDLAKTAAARSPEDKYIRAVVEAVENTIAIANPAR